MAEYNLNKKGFGMSLQILSDDNPLSNQVLPSVWTAYKKPPCRPITEMVDQTSQAFQKGYGLSKEEADKLSSDFWTGSIHDFCIQHLNANLTDEDHVKILQTANEFVKNGTNVRVDENEKDLIKLLAAKVVLNAHQRANHAMSNACFLVEWDRLPKENVFMLQKGISPIFYEKDEFDRSELLKNEVRGVPEDRILDSFSRWMSHAGMRYMPVFNQMGGLLSDMGTMNALILRKSAESYVKEQRKIAHLNNRYLHRERRNWRGHAQ